MARKAMASEKNEQMEELMKDPTKEFQGSYTSSIHQLSAKEGLGKTFGQPRRLAQERMRSEMTKCEQAQKGVDSLIEQLQELCELALDDKSTFESLQEQSRQKNKRRKQEQISVSLRIRKTLVQAIRSICHYSQHLDGFKDDQVKMLPRISYQEINPSIDLDESEKALDEKRKDEELEVLGSIGFKNAKEPYLKFNEAVKQIDGKCKELCQKLYTGDNAKWLVGNDKIPEYLSIFLE